MLNVLVSVLRSQGSVFTKVNFSGGAGDGPDTAAKGPSLAAQHEPKQRFEAQNSVPDTGGNSMGANQKGGGKQKQLLD